MINNTHPPDHQLSKQEAGYVHDKAPYGCVHCKYFQEPACKIVKGRITKNGCCDLWNTDDPPPRTVSQAEAEYVEQEGTDFSCLDCIVFKKDECDWVRGRIDADDSCDKWWYRGWDKPK